MRSKRPPTPVMHGLNGYEPQPLDKVEIRGVMPNANHSVGPHKCDRHVFPPAALLDQIRTSTHSAQIFFLEFLIKAELLCPVQVDNLDTAIAYHREFPPDDPFGTERVYFQHGRRLNNAGELDFRYQFWVEPCHEQPHMQFHKSNPNSLAHSRLSYEERVAIRREETAYEPPTCLLVPFIALRGFIKCETRKSARVHHRAKRVVYSDIWSDDDLYADLDSELCLDSDSDSDSDKDEEWVHEKRRYSWFKKFPCLRILDFGEMELVRGKKGVKHRRR